MSRDGCPQSLDLIAKPRSVAVGTTRQFVEAGILMLSQHFAGFVVVTSVTGMLCVRVRVARFTGHVDLVAVIDLEGVLSQHCGQPRDGGVAPGTVATELPLMVGRFLVAAGAVRGHTFESPVSMTVLALRLHVTVLQNVDALMIEGQRTVGSVVTKHTVTAISIDVGLGQGPVICQVARHAVDGLSREDAVRVTVLADHRFALSIDTVGCQTEPCQRRVIYVGQRDLGDHGVAPLVLSVASLAAVRARHKGVQSFSLGALLSDIQMTGLAPACGDAVNRRMAVLALLLEVCMGSVTTELSARTAHRRDRTRVQVTAQFQVEKRTTGHHRHHDDSSTKPR